MKKTVVITGANGFIGKALIGRMCRGEYYVVAVVRQGEQDELAEFVQKGVRIVENNMEEYAHLIKKIERCDIFISLAWDGTRGKTRDDAERQQKNYLYSMQALYAATDMGCKVFISAGSQAEYGNINGKISEDMPCHPVTEYGKWKFAFFRDASEHCKKNGIAFKEPRFFSLYGENDVETTMIIDILKKMLKNEPCELTECIQNWDYLYISDAVEGIMKLLEVKCDDGIYNFGSGDVRTLKDYVAEMYAVTHSESKLLFGAVPYPDTGMVSIWPDIHKLQKIGWSVQVPFGVGIQKIIDKYGGSSDSR
ncbi:MAG: NAD(P)-dependent oxidoreductase [Blautia sp.]|nr:NAD(P)-dependent oxidoreductase [Blautia sp.]MCM1200967.1 NAD(P)-dependent oxidoreductase [Bacteroides fragilis]